MKTTIYSILIWLTILVDPFAWDFFLSKVAYRKDKRNKWFGIVLLIVYVVLDNTIVGEMQNVSLLLYGIHNIYNVLYFLYAVIYYEIDKKTIVSYIAFNYIMGSLYEYLFSFILVIIFSINTKLFMQPTLLRFTGMFLIQVMSLLTYYLLYIMQVKYTEEIKGKNVFLILMIGFVTDIALFGAPYISNGNLESSLYNVVTIVLLLFETLILIFSIYVFIKEKKKENKYLEVISFTKSQIRQLNDTREQISESRKIFHDMKNHLCTLGLMMEKGMYIEANEYIQKLLPQIDNAEVADISNTIFSIILYEKAAKAKREDVILKYEIGVDDIMLPMTDLNSIVTNMIDNAIEACKKVRNKKDREIIFKVYIKDEDMIMECQNPYVEEPIRELDGTLVTSKMDKIAHGKGIRLIHEFVERNGGDVTIRFRQGTFVIRAVFDNDLAIKGELQ